MSDDLPLAASVLATVRAIIGLAGFVSMQDYGHGLGAIRVTIPHTLTPALKALSESPDWDYVGTGVDEDPEDDSQVSTVEFCRWVRLEKP